MRYARTRYESDEDEKAYRIFLTEEVRALNQSLSGVIGGSTIEMSYMDFLSRVKGIKEKKTIKKAKTEDEIIQYVKSGLHKLAGRR